MVFFHTWVPEKEANEYSDILTDIRDMVDENISYLHRNIMQTISSNLGLNPDSLVGVDKLTRTRKNKKEQLYVYKYRTNKAKYTKKSWVEVDMSGSIKNYISTK